MSYRNGISLSIARINNVALNSFNEEIESEDGILDLVDWNPYGPSTTKR